MPQNKKGTRRERELANAFDGVEPQFAVTREPASGGSTKRKLPDLHVSRTYNVKLESSYSAANWNRTVHDHYAIEAKSSNGNPVYLTQEEIEGLIWYAEQFKAVPLVGVKFDVKHGDPDYGEDSNGWYFLLPEECHRTDGGNYRVKKEKAHADGVSFEQLTEREE